MRLSLMEIGIYTLAVFKLRFGSDAGSLEAALLLGTNLERLGGYEVVLCGGDGNGDGGVCDVHKKWHAHYWLEIETDGGKFIVDITGDRFGFDPVVVWEVQKGRSHYVPGRPEKCRMNLEKQFSKLRFSQAQEELFYTVN